MRQASRRKLVSLCPFGAANEEPYMTDIHLPTYMVLFLLHFMNPSFPSNHSDLFLKLLRIVIN